MAFLGREKAFADHNMAHLQSCKVCVFSAIKCDMMKIYVFKIQASVSLHDVADMGNSHRPLRPMCFDICKEKLVT